MDLQEKIEIHRHFWQGQGPSLILIPSAEIQQYDTENYNEKFYAPKKMFNSEVQRAQLVSDWPTDGIATVRPNLGTVFIPSIAGQQFRIEPGQMPWPGKPLTTERMLDMKNIDVESSQLMKLAFEFYNYKKPDNVAAYLPDTQGIFDIAHMLQGDDIFYDLAEHAEKVRVKAFLSTITELYIKVTKAIKAFNCEQSNSMIHGHGTPQGVYFPETGIRLSEDTSTLLSPAMIDEFVLPYMKQAASPFGSAFVHFCGKHEILYRKIVNCDFVKAIDLGNPELYDTNWLFELCAASNTVFYGKVAALDNENWRDYIIRIAAIAKKTSARVILRPTIHPSTYDQCKSMYDMWHKLTL